MSLLKYIERLKQMDHLIHRKSTGNAKEFAQKLSISSSQVKEEIKQMRQLGARIKFDRERNTYVYKNNCRLILQFDISAHEKNNRPILLDDEQLLL